MVGDVVAGEGGGALAAEGDAGEAWGGAAEGDTGVWLDEGGFGVVNGGAVEENGLDFVFYKQLVGEEVVEGGA